MAQSKVDSLLNLVNKSKEDTLKVILYNKLSWIVYIDNPLDAKKYGKSAIELAQKLNFITGLSEALNKMGIYEKSTGNYQDALNYYNRSMTLAVNLKDSSGICMLLNNIGNVYKSKGDYTMALETLFKALKINEQIKSIDGQADGLLNIGLIYDDLKNNVLALDYLEKSLRVAKKNNDKKRISRALINIANIYSGGKKEDKLKALDYYGKALKIDIETGEKRGQSMCLNNIGAVYFDLGQWTKAEEYYNKSLKIKEETGDRKGKAIINENLAYIAQEKKDYKKAHHYFSIAILIIDSIGDAGLKINLLQAIAENYYLMHDFKLSAETYKILLSLKDSIFNSEMTGQLSEMQTKYETEKKDKEILVLQKDKEIQDKEIGRQKIVRNSITGISILILILLVGSIIAYRDKKKANHKLAFQNEEIKQQKEEIIVQRDSIQEQKEIIEEHQKEIEDSINYAKRIQQAVLPNIDQLLLRGNQYSVFGKQIAEYRIPITDYFVLFKPKDIVSGDFYWANIINEWLIVTVADCTGHGVPGAFMSMLGISFLNEIVRKKEITQASQVLDNLRESIIEALQQIGESGEQKDGMDIALCAINMDTLEMQFAGANNPCYIIANTQPVIAMAQPEAISTAQSDCFVPRNDDCQLIELKGDKQPIGIHTNMQPFTNQIYQLQKGDTIYLMSDGFEDQFGGPNRKKFLAKNIKELLIANCQKPMADQKKILENTIIDWIGTGEQIDDITAMGIMI